MASYIDATFDIAADVQGHHGVPTDLGAPPESEGDTAGAMFFGEEGDEFGTDVVFETVTGPAIPNAYHLTLGGAGSNGDGDFSDGSVALTAEMSVTEALDRINEAVKRIDDETDPRSNVNITGGSLANVLLINVTVDGGEF